MLAGSAGEVELAADELLFRQGDPADRFFLVRHGEVAIETFAAARGPITIETIEAGEPIGWSWLFPPFRWHFDARALVPVNATAFDAATVRAACESDAELGRELVSRVARVVVERLQWTRLRLLDMYGDGTGR